MIYAILGIIAIALTVMFLLGFMHGKHIAMSDHAERLESLCSRNGWMDL